MKVFGYVFAILIMAFAIYEVVQLIRSIRKKVAKRKAKKAQKPSANSDDHAIDGDVSDK